MTGDAQALLGRIARSISGEAYAQVIVVGHADTQPIGQGLQSTYSSNYELSVRRADIVANALRNYLKDKEVVVIGKGSSDAEKFSAGENEEFLERRVDIFVSLNEGLLEKIFGTVSD